MQLKYKFVSTITLSFFMKIIKVQHFVDQIFEYPKKKINPNAIGFGGNGTIPTNKIDGFKERIEAMLPTLIEHRCSEGCRGFFPEWNAVLGWGM
jgi:cyanophycin synthetase